MLIGLTGCFTCRLRRKKCDEGKPLCKACKHLGLSCDYKRPLWWGNIEQRKRQKDAIKSLIKRTKLTEKVSQSLPILSADSPPELSLSPPTSECTSDHSGRFGSMSRNRRSLSIDSGFSLEYDIEEGGVMDAQHMQAYNVNTNDIQLPYGFGAFDVDILTEKQTFVNNFPLRKDSSAFSTTAFRKSSYGAGPSVAPSDTTFAQLDQIMSSPEENMDSFQFLDFTFGQLTPCSISTVPTSSEILPEDTSLPYIPDLDANDRALLDHFLDSVVPIIFPILDLNLHGMARQEVILPALVANKTYMHCCLSIAALHLKASQNIPGEFIDQDIMHHRYAAITRLCGALEMDEDNLQMLEATLGMILAQCSVGHPEDALPDIPWHAHFQAVVSLVEKMNLPRALDEIVEPGIPAQYSPAPLNMTLTAWIDILGATMLGRAPQFADTYREKHLSNGHSGLAELMGCDDQIMYLISEIACLEALKTDNVLSDMDLCEHVKSLAQKIDITEDMAAMAGEVGPVVVYRPDGSTSIDTAALKKHMSDAFRYAARIYLCTLVPRFNRNQIQVKELLNKLVATLEHIPAGVNGFDRSLVWVYLIAGSVATEGSAFRRAFYERNGMLGAHACEGAWGRMGGVLSGVWRVEDEGMVMGRGGGEGKWRAVMKADGGDFLLI